MLTVEQFEVVLKKHPYLEISQTKQCEDCGCDFIPDEPYYILCEDCYEEQWHELAGDMYDNFY